MTEGLKFVKYAILQQESDPLEFCVFTLPIPLNIGIPLFPCELPNNFSLFQSNDNHTQIGMKIMDIEEEETYRIQRAIVCPSARPFTITSRDFYNNIPIQAERQCSIPLIQNATIKVQYDGQYAGKIVEERSCGFCSGNFHQLLIYDQNDYLIFEVVANLRQWGLLCFLPFKQCERITYNIKSKRPDEELKEDFDKIVGTIQHIFYGWDNELCSKADQYGLIFPDDSSEKDKALLIMAALFIDYLWFENF